MGSEETAWNEIGEDESAQALGYNCHAQVGCLLSVPLGVSMTQSPGIRQVLFCLPATWTDVSLLNAVCLEVTIVAYLDIVFL